MIFDFGIVCLTFVFRLNHKQTLKMTIKMLVDNNKTFSWIKTIIEFRIGFYLVCQFMLAGGRSSVSLLYYTIVDVNIRIYRSKIYDIWLWNRLLSGFINLKKCNIHRAASLHMIGLKLIKRFWVFVISTPRL
jgi:hypothetical protein